MEYANARKGLGKIAIAQVFAIIATLFAGGTMLLLKILERSTGRTDELYTGVAVPLITVSIIFAGAFVIMMTVTLLLNGIGFFQASRDDKEFRKAMILALVTGGFSLIGSFFQIPNGALSTIFNSASTIIEMFVMIFAISGIINLSVSCERADMAARGDFVLKFLVATYIAAAMNALVIRIFELSVHARIVSVIIGAVDLMLNVLQFIIFLRYILQARKMLSNN